MPSQVQLTLTLSGSSSMEQTIAKRTTDITHDIMTWCCEKDRPIPAHVNLPPAGGIAALPQHDLALDHACDGLKSASAELPCSSRFYVSCAAIAIYPLVVIGVGKQQLVGRLCIADTGTNKFGELARRLQIGGFRRKSKFSWRGGVSVRWCSAS
eukprot:98143-Rhodomonas_salina.2